MALQDVDLTADPGRVTGLIGPNGAGKTTLFNVITGLQDPTHGRVFINGRDVSGMSPHPRGRLGDARTFQPLQAFGARTVDKKNVSSARFSWRTSREHT